MNLATRIGERPILGSIFTSKSGDCRDRIGKANLVADIRSRAGLVNFAIIFSFDSTLRADSTGRFAAFDYSRIFIGLVRCLLGRLLSGRFRPCVRASVFYLTRTTTGGLDSCRSLLCVSARSHASKVVAGPAWNRVRRFELVFT